MTKLTAVTKLALAGFLSYKTWKWLNEITSEEHNFLSYSLESRSQRKKDDNVIGKLPYFLNAQGLYIFWRVWDQVSLPSAKGSKVKGIVVLCHGLNEHSGRYEHIAQILNSAGYRVYAMDHQGHGHSEGDRVHCKQFSDLVDDFALFWNKIRGLSENKGLKMFLLGHSMGGLISVLATQKLNESQGMLGKNHPGPDALILSAPALYIDEAKAPHFIRPLLHLISDYLPKLRLLKLDIATLSHDKNVVDFYLNDPLHFNGASTMRMVSQLSKSIDLANANATKFAAGLPLLMYHGDKDELVLIKGSIEFFSKLTLRNKEFKTYQGGFHELFNEPNFEQGAIKDVLEWLKKYS